MKFKLDIGVGEFLDRITILEIKKLNNLDVDAELAFMNFQLQQFDSDSFIFFKKLLFEINSILWDIEGKKRSGIEPYTNLHSELSTFTIVFNDFRYLVKKQADLFYKSKNTEKKSHFEMD